jgi:zinc protease
MKPWFWLAALLLTIAGNLQAQELTHPTRMGLPDSDFTRPDPADFQLVLDNGLIAYVAEASQVPLVTMSAFIRVGKIDDAQQGAAEALLDVLVNSGPANSSPAEYRAMLDAMAAEYTVRMHDEWTEISLNVPTEDLDAALPLFAAIVTSPRITESSLQNAAKQAAPDAADHGAESGTALYEGSLTMAVEDFYAKLYEGHPYGYRPTASDYGDLTVADVSEFHARYFVPANLTLAIAGDIDIDAIQGEIVSLFGDIDFAAAPPAPSVPAIALKPQQQHTRPVEKLQSWLVFGHVLPQVPLADHAALEVMNYILAGGHLYTRMTVETRYRYGYTNDASGFLEPKWFGPGGYDFRSYSRHEVIKPIFDNMMAEIDRIQAEKVTDEELFIAKGALTDGTFQIRYLDGYAITRDFAIEQLRYRNHSRSADYVDRIRAVDVDDVMMAAKKYLHRDNMQIILIGNAIELTE